MPAINTDSLLSHIWSILTPQQHAMVTNFVMTGDKTAATATPSANTGQNLRRKRSTAAKRARTSKAKIISPTVAKLTAFFGANPGGHTLADLAKGTGVRPNILGRSLKANNAFRQSGEMWLLNRGAVDRTLTSGDQQKAA